MHRPIYSLSQQAENSLGSARFPGQTQHATQPTCVHACVHDSLRPHRPSPARLLCPWDSPGKNTGVGCHALLQGILPTQGQSRWLLPSALADGFFTNNATWEAPPSPHQTLYSRPSYSDPNQQKGCFQGDCTHLDGMESAGTSSLPLTRAEAASVSHVSGYTFWRELRWLQGGDGHCGLSLRAHLLNAAGASSAMLPQSLWI